MFTRPCDTSHYSIIYDHNFIVGQSLPQWGFSIHRIVQTEIVYGTNVRCETFRTWKLCRSIVIHSCYSQSVKKHILLYFPALSCPGPSILSNLSSVISLILSSFVTVLHCTGNVFLKHIFFLFLSLSIFFFFFFRNSVMFNNELMADVHFVVGQPGRTQRLPGHRVRISSSSGVTAAGRELTNKLSGTALFISEEQKNNLLQWQR